MGELAADGEPKAGSTMFPARAGVGLLEGLEDDLLFFLGDADARVGSLESGHHGRLAENRMIGTPAVICRRDLEPYTSLLRELEGIGQEVLEHLLKAFRGGGDAAPQIGIKLHIEGKTARLRFMTERSRHGLNEARKGDFLSLNRHGARLDLG